VRFTEDSERFNDIDGYVDPNDEPVCVCAEYHGAIHPTFCRGCGDWTDNIEIAKMEAAEETPAATRRPLVDAAALEPGRTYLLEDVINVVKVRARRGRTMRVLLACDWNDLSDREKMRVYRYQGGVA
jgi:hypothetical protein